MDRGDDIFSRVFGSIQRFWILLKWHFKPPFQWKKFPWTEILELEVWNGCNSTRRISPFTVEPSIYYPWVDDPLSNEGGDNVELKFDVPTTSSVSPVVLRPTYCIHAPNLIAYKRPWINTELNSIFSTPTPRSCPPWSDMKSVSF